MKIIWSNQAKISYEKTIDLILKQWSVDIAIDFENKTNNLLDKLKTNSKLCPNSKKFNYENVLFTKTLL